MKNGHQVWKKHRLYCRLCRNVIKPDQLHDPVCRNVISATGHTEICRQAFPTTPHKLLEFLSDIEGKAKLHRSFFWSSLICAPMFYLSPKASLLLVAGAIALFQGLQEDIEISQMVFFVLSLTFAGYTGMKLLRLRSKKHQFLGQYRTESQNAIIIEPI